MTKRNRNLNPYTYFENLAAEHRPRYAFGGRTPDQFEKWKAQVLPQVLDSMGTMPARVDPHAELLARWTEHGLVKERWVMDVQPGLSATVLIYRPDGLSQGEKRPAILCCHGHGPLGKDAPMGNIYPPTSSANHNANSFDYGRQMAQAGFVTYSLDWLGFGERNAANKPHYSSAISLGGESGRDPCNVYYLCATMLGTTVLAMNCHDAMRVTDLVCEQPYVDGAALGVMGCSLGGTMATWMALVDKRFAATDIICYSGPWHEIAYRTYNVCGSQVTPGIYSLVDVADLQGLIAPRPVLIELGLQDSCFEADYTQENYKQLQRIFQAAGVPQQLELDLFPGEHSWGGNQSRPFFRKHLKAHWQA